jgi:hypothetical protein
MWIYEISTAKTGCELVMGESAQEAVKALEAAGFTVHKSIEGEYIIDTVRPYEVTGNEKIYMTPKAAKSTTMYKGIAKGTGLKYKRPSVVPV